MPDDSNRKNHGFSQFDNMSTEVLREILRTDSQLPAGKTSNVEAMLYISEVIAKREKEDENVQLPDIDNAWKSFNRNYRPYLQDGESLYENREDADSQENGACAPSFFKAQNRPQTGRKRKFLWTVGILASVIAVMFAISVTAYAFGYNLWDAVAEWTKDTFGFETVNTALPEQLSELWEEADAYGLSKSLLPTHVPEGYEVVETWCKPRPAYTSFFCALQKGDSMLRLKYRMYTKNNCSAIFEKDVADPEIYTQGGTDYYIMTNYGELLVVWISGNVECSIYSPTSREELIKMIDSIYGG